MRRERIALGVLVASMAALAAVTACKKKSCPEPAPAPAPAPGPAPKGVTVQLLDRDGVTYGVTIDDGVSPPISLPVSGDHALIGDEKVLLKDLSSGARPSPMRPCPCTLQRCIPFCRVVEAAAAGSGSVSPQP